MRMLEHLSSMSDGKASKEHVVKSVRVSLINK
jgi:hypothetical protein